MKFEAKIRGFPKHQGVLWKKDNQYININTPKYEGSTESGDNPVLCINDVIDNDIDLYTIEVNTSSGIKQCGQILEVLKGKEIPRLMIREFLIDSILGLLLLHARVQKK